MRILYDGTTLRAGQTGIGYYTEHLLHALYETMDRDEIILVSNREIQTTLPLGAEIRIWERHRFRYRALWMQLIAPHVVGTVSPDVAHFTNSVGPVWSAERTLITLYDMSLHTLPQFHPWRRMLSRILVSLSVGQAEAVITISETSKADIARHLGVPPAKIKVIHGAAAPIFRPVMDATILDTVRSRYRLGKRIILFVGTLEPRKNLPRLIKGFSMTKAFREGHYQLLCVGSYGWGTDQVFDCIERHGLSQAVRVAGYVPLEELPALYSLADVFVYPSLYEGFGLPVVEAMACGTAVAVAASPALLEVAGDAALNFNPLEPGEIAATLDLLSGDRDLRSEYERRSLKRAAYFSWSRAARETLELYRAVAAGKEYGKESGPRPLVTDRGKQA